MQRVMISALINHISSATNVLEQVISGAHFLNS